MVLDKIRKLRGMFYRKLQAEEKPDESLPGLRFEKTTRIVELPTFEDVSRANIIYPLIEPFSYAHIKWEPENKEIVYTLIEPVLNENERKLLDKIVDALIQLVEVEMGGMKDMAKAIEYLQKQLNKVLKDFGMQLKPNQYIKLMYFVYRDFLGYNEIDSLMNDPNIEDISCDGVNTPVYIVHRKYGSIKTDIAFKDMENLRKFIIKLAERCGRYVSYAEPILDGTLPTGSRVSATLAGDVATRGPTFTIRKFGDNPMSPVEQIDLKTLSPEMLAYFWYLIEHGANMLFVGGTATGKTTLLNSVCMFIPPEKKIVSIEDTKEIRVPHEHWVSGLTRTGFGIPLPTGEKYGEITMYDLLRESFRQNPDYVIVGETRGKEAYVMFQGMASGHSSLSTFHAGSVDAVVKRLTSPPIELSPVLIESLNVIAIMSHSKEHGGAARRVREVVEIISVDPKTEEVKTNLIFLWNPSTDTFEKVNESQIIPKLLEGKGGNAEDAKRELDQRRTVLEWLHANNVKEYIQVVKYINMYYKEPEKLFQKIGKEWEKKEEKPKVKVDKPAESKKVELQQVPVAVSERPRRKESILGLLGLKVVRERPH